MGNNSLGQFPACLHLLVNSRSRWPAITVGDSFTVLSFDGRGCFWHLLQREVIED